MTILRRAVLAGSAAAVLTRHGSALADGNPQARLAALERINGGRLGAAILDTGTGRRIEHRAGERFALCSTFKLLAAALVLRRVDRGEERLDRRIAVGQADLLSYAPAAAKHVGDSMSLDELCEAAVTLSDNTAANLMLAGFGGPPGLTAFMRDIGDGTTRLDRNEPTLNEATPGDPRDTTSPGAMIDTLNRIVLGDVLSSASRDKLIGWLVGNRTGDKRLRAGVPQGWRVGDKTGTGNRGATNDIGVIWPPNRAPVVVAVYYGETAISADRREAVIAEVARVAADMP